MKPSSAKKENEKVGTVREFVLTTVRNEILTGGLVPGQRLVEGDMCTRLGVSRTSVREVFRQLEAERLVNIEPYKGPSVAKLTWAEAEEIYTVRELLEGEAASLFAQKITPEETTAMEVALARFKHAVTESYDRRELLDSTNAFYDVILNGCGNALLAELLRGLLARINLLRSRSMSLSERPKQSLEEMAAILTALKTGDPDRARGAAVQHIHNAREFARDAMEKNNR
ncbi:GntR family transcriptional regulator [Hwanghaeella sp. LZ110]|uniref:GntR family transcriptional regulator n=1 Tax=Hwanghaeella sp. LZ110 TaxID=3402810 RepID=UPI003B682392